MAITLTLKNRTELNTLVNALDVHYDISADTVLEDLYLTPEEVRNLATKSDDYIQKELQVLRNKVSRRIDELVTTSSLLARVNRSLDTLDGK